MEEPLAFLELRKASRDVIDGLRPIAGDWKTLWNECTRGDWLLGIADKLGVAHEALVRAAIGCAKVALDSLDGELHEAATRVLGAASTWADGTTSADEVATRTRELEEAMTRAGDPVTDAAARASLAVGLGVAERDVLASAPAAAAEATILATMDCGLAMAMRWAHDKCAAAVRAAIPWEDVDAIVSRG